MTTATTTAQRRETRSRRPATWVLLVIGAAALSVGSGLGTLALFTDQETVSGSFSAGTIALDAGEIAQLTLTTDNMMPGDSTTDDVVVQNDGSDELRYAMSTSSTDPDGKGMRDVLTLTVRTGDATGPSTGCDDFDGGVVYDGPLGASTAGFGSATAGADAGDRNLAAGAGETLCFRVTLPAATGDAYQGSTTTTTFTFSAEQTANNP